MPPQGQDQAEAAIISRRRFQWPAITPAGRVNNARGRVRAEDTTPALAAVPVAASTSRG